MSTLSTLIRLARQQVDEAQRALGDVESQRGALARRELELEHSVRNEQGIAAAHADALFAYGDYAQAALANKRAFLEEAARLTQAAATLRADLAAAFIELKKLETLAEAEEARARARLAAAETAALDEVGARAARGAIG